MLQLHVQVDSGPLGLSLETSYGVGGLVLKQASRGNIARRERDIVL